MDARVRTGADASTNPPGAYCAPGGSAAKPTAGAGGAGMGAGATGAGTTGASRSGGT
jgi:hypothetical protein